MQYLTGRLAFAIPCKLQSCGLWNVSKKEFQDPEKFKLSESDDSLFKDWGIEQNKLVPGREFCSYNVANHVRAYLDMLMTGDLDALVGMYDEAIADPKSRMDIFMIVNSRIRKTEMWPIVNAFLSQEFDSLWDSFVKAVDQSADIVEKNYREFEKEMEMKARYVHG